MFEKKTIRDIEVAGKRILMRADFNVPLKDGVVSDDTRIRAALPSIQYLLKEGACLILCSHLGRPKGKPDPALSLKPVAEKLSELLERDVRFEGDCVGADVEKAAASISAGEVLLLENTRFHAEEKANDPTFAGQLAGLADVFVNDAFGSAHRAHASTEGVARYLPAVAGFLMQRELENLGKAVSDPEHPFIAILGGAKVSDKIGVVQTLLGKADYLLIGGGMANTFLAAQGMQMGLSLVEEDALATARELLQQGGERLVLPDDAVVADAFDADANHKIVAVDAVPENWRVLDIGPKTVEHFQTRLAKAKLVVWNGPMGVFEFPAFAEGTMALARAVAELDATVVIGGGDSAAAVHQAGVADRVTHVSTGGGASLEFLEGKSLPGVAVLQNR